MKKFLIIIFLLLLNNCTFALDNISSKLTKIENHLFGYNYSNIPNAKRLEKIEKEVYGKEKKGTFNNRLSQVGKDLYVDILDEKNDNNTAYQFDDENSDDSVDYPIIDDIERKMNIKSPPKQDLNSRLAVIENDLFKKINTSDDYYTRLEKIKNKLGYNNSIANSYSDLNFERNDYDDFFEYNSATEEQTYLNPFNTYKLSVLEQKILKDTYPYDNNDRRLSRLENYIFSTDFSKDNDKIRISRLEEAVKSMQYNKHDNKLQRTINTAMQIATMVLMVLAIIL